MTPFIHLKDLDYFAPLQGLKAKVIHTTQQTYSFWEMDKDTVLPAHQHPHEQVSIITSGRLELTIGDTTQIMEPGMVAVIPSNTLHGAKALSDATVIDVFYPQRTDFITLKN